MRALLIMGMLLGGMACGPEGPEDGEAGSAAPAPAREAGPGSATSAADSSEVVAAVAAFHRALADADTATVDGLLADDVLVLEGGGVEDRSEYLGHHLGADMAFAAAVPGTREVIRVSVADSVAWLISRSRRQGTFRDREIDSQGAELMVLRRGAEGWRITAIHWSAR